MHTVNSLGGCVIPTGRVQSRRESRTLSAKQAGKSRSGLDGASRLYWSFVDLDLMVLRRHRGRKMIIVCHKPLGPSQA